MASSHRLRKHKTLFLMIELLTELWGQILSHALILNLMKFRMSFRKNLSRKFCATPAVSSLTCLLNVGNASKFSARAAKSTCKNHQQWDNQIWKMMNSLNKWSKRKERDLKEAQLPEELKDNHGSIKPLSMESQTKRDLTITDNNTHTKVLCALIAEPKEIFSKKLTQLLEIVSISANSLTSVTNLQMEKSIGWPLLNFKNTLNTTNAQNTGVTSATSKSSSTWPEPNWETISKDTAQRLWFNVRSAWNLSREESLTITCVWETTIWNYLSKKIWRL